MESELQQYLSHIGLHATMLKPARVKNHSQPTPATLYNGDNDKNEEDRDDTTDSAPAERVVDVIVADSGLVSSTAGLHVDGDQSDVKVSDASPTATASLTTTDNCSTAADIPSKPTDDCINSSEDLAQHVALLDLSNSDNDVQTSTLQTPSSADNGSVESVQQQTDTANSNVLHLDCGKVSFESVTPQSSGARPAVVYSTIPRHVDNASTLSSSQTLHPPVSSSSCTVMVSGPAADEPRSSPTRHREAADRQVEVGGPVKRPSPDSMSYTSTIIRCSASSAPIIATSTTKSRDKDAPATAVDQFETVPPAKPQIKKTPNYVSVVQIGSSTPGTPERRAIATMTMSSECVNGGSATLQSSPLTGRQHTNTPVSDESSSAPTMKSSLKKAPGHTKNKSVSFSTGSADNDDEESVTATTTETSNISSHHPSLTDAIVRLDRDHVDGIVPRRAVVSDSGIFCEPDDDQTPLNSDDIKVTTTQPSRRTTVVVSGGVAAVKNGPRHPQRDELADLAATKTDNRISSPGSRTRNVGSNPGPLRPQQVSAPGCSATINITNNVTETKKLTTEDTVPDDRRRASDTNQVTCNVFRFTVD